MAPDAGGPKALHHVVYRWTAADRFGRSGLRPIATSLTHGELERWEGELEPHISMEQGEHTPQWSLCRVHTGLGPVLVHRESSVHGSGRRGNNAHVLLDPEGVLRTRVALVLAAHIEVSGAGLMPGRVLSAIRQDEPLPPLPLRGLEYGTVSHEGLRTRARSGAGALTAVAAAVLRDPPRTSYTLRLRDVDDDPVGVLWGVVELLAPLVEGGWTFSTFESSDGEVRPRFTFVPAWPHRQPSADRRRLEPGQDPLDDSAGRAAAALVAWYTAVPWDEVKAGLDGLRREVKGLAHEDRAWRLSHLFAPHPGDGRAGGRPAAPPAARPAVASSPRPEHGTRHPHASGSSPGVHPGPATGSPPGTDPVVRPPRPAGGPPPRPRGPVSEEAEAFGRPGAAGVPPVPPPPRPGRPSGPPDRIDLAGAPGRAAPALSPSAPGPSASGLSGPGSSGSFVPGSFGPVSSTVGPPAPVPPAPVPPVAGPPVASPPGRSVDGRGSTDPRSWRDLGADNAGLVAVAEASEALNRPDGSDTMTAWQALRDAGLGTLAAGVSLADGALLGQLMSAFTRALDSDLSRERPPGEPVEEALIRLLDRLPRDVPALELRLGTPQTAEFVGVLSRYVVGLCDDPQVGVFLARLALDLGALDGHRPACVRRVVDAVWHSRYRTQYLREFARLTHVRLALLPGPAAGGG